MIRNLLENAGYEVFENNSFEYIYCFGVKVEWWKDLNKIHLGYGNGEDDRKRICNDLSEYFLSNFGLEIRENKTYIRIFIGEDKDLAVKVWNEILNYLELNGGSWSKPIKNNSSNNIVENTGVTFEGTVFQNIKERGVTISPMFGKMVCNASGMNLEKILCEYYIEGGRIDGVELSDSNDIISIYECGSGIHKGSFLDWDHWNKILCRYLYSNDIFSENLKRVVILAGGYQKEMLDIKENISTMLQKSGIDFILLKTERNGDEINVVKI